MKYFSKGLFLLFAITGLFCCEQNQKEIKPYQRPNIILIMGDDMGYSDLACYGGEINTPNLDQLARSGLRYTQFYNTARCCPTRASLLTGLYPQQAGIGHMVNDRGTPAFRGDLSANAMTIAEVLKGAGYSTYMSGKWHVTPWPHPGDIESKHNWPRQRGFDEFYGMISGAGSFYDPRSLVLDNEYIVPNEDYYFTDAITDYAVERINEHRGDNPFFMYVAYTVAHWPMHALPEDIAKYKGKYDEGWDMMRERRLKKMIEMGLIPEDTPLSERDSRVQPWTAEIEHREWEIANMEVYAAMVDRMDAGIGKIVEELEQKGKLENTLIFFLQDNGACAEELEWVQRPSDHENPQNIPDGYSFGKDDLQTYMIPKFTRDGRPVTVQNKEIMPGSDYTYTAYGKNWANASNTPFRFYKHWVHEGGIATPLVVHWPNGIADKNEFRWEPSHLIDIMATCADVGKADYPTENNGKSIIPLEGRSLVPTFEEKPLDREAIYWEHEGNRAVRLGEWKLVSKAEFNSFVWDKVNELELSNWELYNIDEDRNELNDIASEHVERVQEMATMWLAWAERSGSIPRPY